MTRRPCGHCHGTGLCDLVCCMVFGNVAWARRPGEARPHRVRVCMVCRGTGQVG